jgi:hypothetical protein
MGSNPYNLAEARPFDLEFDGRRCSVRPLSAKKAREVSTKLLLIISRALKESAAGRPATQLQFEVMGTSTILEHVAAADMLEWLTDKFIDTTEVERNPDGGVEDDFMPLRQAQDFLFVGDGMGRWFRWLAFCIEVNCSGFFAELQRQAPLLKTKMSGSPTKTASQSPST